jgi:hypothetical protein
VPTYILGPGYQIKSVLWEVPPPEYPGIEGDAIWVKSDAGESVYVLFNGIWVEYWKFSGPAPVTTHQKPSTVDRARYPKDCPKCKSPAYEGFNGRDCSNKACR